MRISHGFAALAVSLSAPVYAQPSVPDALAIQVGLDRAGFSPGVIDGVAGRLTKQALRGFQQANGLTPTGTLDEATQQALGTGEATRTVAVTDADAAGPFVAEIPDAMEDKAKLDGLHYKSIEEALAEKYHTTPAKLRELNPGADFKPGSEIVVPAIAAVEAAGAESWDVTLARLSVAKAQPAAARIVVDKSDREVRAYDSGGKLIAQFPATMGSSHDPLPLGKWEIRGVAPLPPFFYNPDLFWDAKAADEKAKLPPGPNGPVGVVWIDLSKEHYGIHGTPEPQTISRTASHGCIRLTNWDAARLAQMVKPGTPAILQR